MKRFISLFLVVILSANNLFAEDNIISEVCVETGSMEYFPITDERGNIILTKKEIDRECTLTKTVQGACIKWETINEEFRIEAEDYDAYRSQNHEGAMGSMLAMIGAYDQLEHLWSGWKGYCEIGTKTNFDWAEDPMFWAGLMASTMMDGSAVTKNADGSIASKGFMADTSLGEGIRGAQDTVGSFAADNMGAWVGKAAGKCLMAGGFDMARSMYGVMGNSQSDDMCDNVDEFCGSQEEQTEESDIITIDKQQYLDMIEQHPDAADYIIILDEEDGIMTVRFKKLNEMEGADAADQEQLKKMKEDLQQMQMLVSVAIVATKMAACAVTDGGVGTSADTSSKNEDDKMFSTKNGAGFAISSIPAEWLGPYGALIKAAMQIVLNLAYSFEDIDSCHNQDDADEQGDRHARTAEALPHELCYAVSNECVENCEDNFMGMASELVGYNYCCYDQILTKVLVVQLKAQLGRDWAHCTGITLRDLNFVSFEQCTDEEMASGIDGGLENQGEDYDPMATFQYKNKCVDLAEFKDYLKAQIGDDIDLSDFDSIFNDVKGQAGSM